MISSYSEQDMNNLVNHLENGLPSGLIHYATDMDNHVTVSTWIETTTPGILMTHIDWKTLRSWNCDIKKIIMSAYNNLSNKSHLDVIKKQKNY